MEQANTYRGLRFESSRRSPRQRLVLFLGAIAVFTLIWVIVPPSTLYWLMLPLFTLLI